MLQETIAIAGAEREMGSLLARKLSQLNHYRLLLLSEEENQLKDLQEMLQQKTEAGPEVINCLKDACWEADIIVLDIPPFSFPEVADKIREVSTQKIVFVLSGNEHEALAPANPVKLWQDLLPNAKMVVALNSSTGSGITIAGNDEESLHRIAEIIKRLGFEPTIKTVITNKAATKTNGKL